MAHDRQNSADKKIGRFFYDTRAFSHWSTMSSDFCQYVIGFTSRSNSFVCLC